jgi:hypothetical protein
MKRDMDLVRKIILDSEGRSEDEMQHGNPEIDGYSEEVIGHHVFLMWQAGLLDAVECTAGESSRQALILNMTWKGHDFADASRSSAAWDHAKKIMSKVGAGGIDMMIDVLKHIAREQLQKLGIGD